MTHLRVERRAIIAVDEITLRIKAFYSFRNSRGGDSGEQFTLLLDLSLNRVTSR